MNNVKENKVSFNLITGFLGSGKTTLLKRILTKIGSHKKVAVIQNEFANTGVDGRELKSANQNFKLLEINNGSVFCVCQLNNFIETVRDLLQNYKPEIIFLETSGLADPISIAELLAESKLTQDLYLGNIITIVDAPNFDKALNMLPRVKHQIMIADKVIVNKMDAFDGNTNTLKQQIYELNPFSELLFTQFTEVDLEQLFEYSETSTRAADIFKGKSEGRPDWNCTILRIHKKTTKEKLLLFISSIAPDCPRIKGFVNLENGETQGVQSVFEKTVLQPMNNYTGRSELVIFTTLYTPTDIRKISKSFL